MRIVDSVVVHCLATKPSMDVGVEEVRDWHVNERGWDDVGYHYIIRRDGTLESGRQLEVGGAHARGYNSRSIGVAYAGGLSEDGEPENNITENQIVTLSSLLELFVASGLTSWDRIYDHSELDPNKPHCPGLAVPARHCCDVNYQVIRGRS